MLIAFLTVEVSEASINKVIYVLSHLILVKDPIYFLL